MQIILKLLAEHKEFEQYKMKKAISISYKTIIENLKRLEHESLVKYRTEKSNRGGKEKKIYSITFKGLIHSLINSGSTEGIEKIAKVHSDRLLTFSKFSLFEDSELKGKLVKNIMGALLSEIVGSKNYSSIGLSLTYKSEKEWRDIIDALVLVNPILNGDYDDAYVKVCKGDGELNDFITESLAKIAKRLGSQLEMIQNWNNSPLV
jgi:hypothetical protein